MGDTGVLIGYVGVDFIAASRAAGCGKWIPIVSPATPLDRGEDES